MGKIKAFFRKQSIKKSFVIHLIICLVVAFFLAVFSSAVCQWAQDRIRQKYEPQRRSYEAQIVTEFSDVELAPIHYYTVDIEDYYTDMERLLNNILSFMSFAVVPLWFIVCIVITSAQFYRRNFKKPLAVLDAAASEIACQNLDFEVYYEKKDEMGRLCDSFERMRLALKENNREMWRQMEERKRLNAAFSHDLRTPLTVLKGQSEMLVKYVPEGKMTTEKIVATAQTMGAHISRLEEYVQTMNRIQKLEDLEVRGEEVSVKEIASRLRDCADILCQEKKFVLQTPEDIPCPIRVDMAFVMQVCENLLSNAVRYAKSRIAVEISIDKELKIKFCDDGPGFSNKDINDAVRPFYQGTKQSHNSQHSQSIHFGMGLYICKILCEKHKGTLTLTNSKQGSAVTASFSLLPH